jgi:hypothetical protein
MKKIDLDMTVADLRLVADNAQDADPNDSVYDKLLINCREFVKAIYKIRRPKKTFVNFNKFKIANRGMAININIWDHSDAQNVKVGEVIRVGLDDYEVLDIDRSLKGELQGPGDNFIFIVRKM